MGAFKEWFAKRYPDCDAYTLGQGDRPRVHVWFAYAGEEPGEAMVRLGDALDEYLEETPSAAVQPLADRDARDVE